MAKTASLNVTKSGFGPPITNVPCNGPVQAIMVDKVVSFAGFASTESLGAEVQTLIVEGPLTKLNCPILILSAILPGIKVPVHTNGVWLT